MHTRHALQRNTRQNRPQMPENDPKPTANGLKTSAERVFFNFPPNPRNDRLGSRPLRRFRQKKDRER